jgi:hypothetical protein
VSQCLDRIQRLVAARRIRISYHDDEELADDVISADHAVGGISEASVIEEYPDTGRGPSILALQHDRDGRPIHVVWATAYDRDG